MLTDELLKRIDFVLSKGNKALSTERFSEILGAVVDPGLQAGFRSAGLSIIDSIYGQQHSYYQEFNKEVTSTQSYHIEAGINILQSISEEVSNGWLIKIKTIATAEIFSDFLEMSKYFLDENYKDPAAVMIGSVLEGHLRQLCTNHSIDLFIVKGINQVPKKADVMNADLAKAGVYNSLLQKSVTAWSGLRNSAAHGKYEEYNQEQVKLMYQGVLDFVTRIQ